jgi:hypothetical protein
MSSKRDQIMLATRDLVFEQGLQDVVISQIAQPLSKRCRPAGMPSNDSFQRSFFCPAFGMNARSKYGISAATDLYGPETVEAARQLGVPDTRISVIAA